MCKVFWLSVFTLILPVCLQGAGAQTKDLQVNVDILLVNLNKADMERFLGDVGMRENLTKEQARQVLLAAQAAKVMQLPRIKTADRQTGTINLCDQQNFMTAVTLESKDGRLAPVPKIQAVEVGIKGKVCPMLFADRRTIQVKMALEMANVELPVHMTPVTIPVKNSGGEEMPFHLYIQHPKLNKKTVEKTLDIPDGQTAVVHLGEQVVEVQNEIGTPVLSQIPVVGRFFRTVGYGQETRHMLLLVTPRVITE